MGFIPQEIIQQVLDRCDIVEVISSYIPLKRTGRNYKANCPFHHEKTPSFIVSQDKQIYHCFGCGVGGNVISFVMAQEHLEFPDAVRHLAQKIGVRIETSERGDKKKRELRHQIYQANQWACQYFHENLLVNKSPMAVEGRRYLKSRGIELDSVKKAQIGMALDQWDGLLAYMNQKGVSLQVLQKAGLIIPRSNREGFFDRFRNRIMFPIFDSKGRCVAFGGRTLEKDNAAKYMNSPESVIYTKGQHLYGLNWAKDDIVLSHFAIVVEGYLDQVTSFQAGIRNIVASLGTALTIEQVRLLRRYTKEITVLFDSDAAGEQATLRSLDLLIEEGLNVKVTRLPKGFDPDLFIRQKGLKEFQEKISQAYSLFDFKLSILFQQYDKQTIEGRAQICAAMLPTIAKWDNEIIRFEYIRKLARSLLISEEPLVLQMNKYMRKGSLDFKDGEGAPVVELASGISAVERNLLKLIMEEQDYIPLLRRDVVPEEIENGHVLKIMAKIYELVDQGEPSVPSSLMSHFEDQQVIKIISELMTAEDLLVGDKKKIYQDCIARIKKDRLKTERRRILRDMEQAQSRGNIQKVDELLRKYNQLIKG